MKTVEVAGQDEIQDFIDFPFRLHGRRGRSLWVPPLKSDLRVDLDRERHPFYRDEGSDAQAYLVKDGCKVRGRIMVIESGPYNREHGTESAFFYFFESEDDEGVANSLFQASFDWARERGLDQVIGPMGLLAGDGHGVLVDGFDKRPGMGMPWNPPCYEGLVESGGFRKLADTLSAEVPLDMDEHRDMVENLYRSAEKVKAKRGLRVKTYENKEEVRDDIPFLVPSLCRVFNSSFGELPFFHPMNEEEMERIVNQMLTVTDGRSVRLVKFAMKGDELIGFLLVYPNIAAGLRRANGRLWPLGWLYLSLERRFTSWVDANGIGILPEYQGKGATVVLYAELLKTLEKSRFDKLIINQILEKNHKNLREMEIFGVTEFDRVHRIYRRDL